MCLKRGLSKFLIPVACVTKFVTAQHASNIGISAHYGFIFAHSQDVQNTKGANPAGIELLKLWRDTSQQTYNACKCNVQKGFNVVYFNYDNRILGSAIAGNFVFEPTFNLTKKATLAIKGQFGLAYQTNPYDAVKNPTNMSYSLPVSFYGGLSVGTGYFIKPRLQVALYGNYLHTSNGGIKDPNKGVNWPTANIALNYYMGDFIPINYTKNTEKINKDLYFNVYGFYSSRTTAIGQKARYHIYGISADMVKPLSAINGLIAGAELYNDLSVAKRLQNDNLKNISSLRSGVTAGNVFLLGSFNFTQQLGFYLYNPTPYFSNIYHRWMLNYQTKSNLLIGASLKAHAQVANFIDFRLGYRFK
jgi:hypothetical protein